MKAVQIQGIFYNNPDRYPPIINSIRLLSQAGFSYDLLCRENGEIWNIHYPATARLRRIEARRGSSWEEYLRFVRQCLNLTDSSARVFIGHDMHGLLPARLLATRYHRPLVYHCHDYAENSRKLPMGSHVVRLFERACARTADLVIVPDADRSRIVKQELQLRNDPLVVANAPRRETSERRGCLHHALALQGFHFSHVIFRQGSLGPYHAIDQTIRSIPYWNDKSWGFVVMGAGETEYVASLCRLARELNVDDRFVELPPVPYDQVADYTSEASVGHALYIPVNLNHQYATTASNKIMEYMAAGLPLLVSDRPGLRALVEKYGCGVTAEESSPESIASAINSLMADTKRACQMGQAGRRTFEEIFCYERQFAPVLDALQGLIA